MAARPKFCTVFLLALLTNIMPLPSLQDSLARRDSRLTVRVHKDKLESTPEIVCENHAGGMRTKYFYFKDGLGGCEYLSGKLYEAGTGSVYDRIQDSCNGRTSCSFEDIDDSEDFLNCTLDIYITCMGEDISKKKITSESIPSSPKPTPTVTSNERKWEIKEKTPKTTTPPPQATTEKKTPSKTVNGDDGEEDDNSKDDLNMVSMILLIAIIVAVIAFIALFVIIVLCGLFVCGWSPRFDRWNNARRQKTQHPLQQHNRETRLDQYVYVDDDALISVSQASPAQTSPMSVVQPDNSQVKWRTPDVCHVTQRSQSPTGDDDDYAEIAENETNGPSPGSNVVEKPSPLASPKPGPTAYPKVLPSDYPKGSFYQNHKSFKQPLNQRFPVLPSSPKAEPVEYTLPIPKSQRPLSKSQSNSTDSTSGVTTQEHLGNSEGKDLTRKLSHNVKVVPAPIFLSRPLNSSKKEARSKQKVPSVRRASLPRHSKLMEGDTDIELWACADQASRGNQATSQPSLAKDITHAQSSTQLYSCLGNHKAVPVVGNIYNG
ncbi:hypothetical protein EGW08_015311 [Elysia chlorotica]|uniref:SUEL-type lectin domain-containing protein n=1 Tax=Elysia chlorotica TaxID=188477 RepID=A0A433T5V5_ELYCH|nr:hypothetical protein EGW08_015311 [Elysia chlorotica]